MRSALAALIILLASAPAAAQVNDAFPMETRVLLAALASTDEAVATFEHALYPSDSAAAASDAARHLRQRGLKGTVEAARADLLLEMVAALRAEVGAEVPLHDEEIELRLLLDVLQAYGDDLVEIDDCAEGEPPLDFERAVAQAAPTFARVRELSDLIEARLQPVPGLPEDEP
jgi:hypothetical protein